MTTQSSQSLKATAWSAEWIDLSSSATGSPSIITPPRSGHVAFGLEGAVYLFGGYIEEPAKSNDIDIDIDSQSDSNVDRVMPVRYPTNDLWKWDNQAGNWNCVQISDLWSNQGEANPNSKLQPQQRLAAAAASTSDRGFIFGGWDSQDFGTGGVILDDIAAFSATTGKWESSHAKASLPNLGAPTSRLVATTLDDGNTILLHNHRSEKSVLLFRSEQGLEKVVEQETSGEAPSPRGLHAATTIGKFVVVFGGAAQDGNMSNEVFVLDTKNWKWIKVQILSDEVPTERASPCLVSLEGTASSCQCVLFGGADRSLADQGVGLHGCDDTWLLDLDTSKNKEGSVTGTWKRFNLDLVPPGRNAATLTRLDGPPATLAEEVIEKDVSYFLLAGGWYPFQKTHSDCFILKVSKISDS